MNDSWRPPVVEERATEHLNWCVGGLLNTTTHCQCDDRCCTVPLSQSTARCVCRACDRTCPAVEHMPARPPGSGTPPEPATTTTRRDVLAYVVALVIALVLSCSILIGAFR